ncbi:metalloregulator ArsR/SmtB family transcription factor [Celeribacter halophilus]|uniref:ArsR/SmtB family transcription factor n=1 Tax=Celeribacter halophilus TaxID=576117 RepID=UPI002FD5D089
MNKDLAIGAFAALAHDARLSVFRLLVQRGPEGTPAMELGRLLDLKSSTLSGHLSVLKRAGLVTTERHHREIHYAPNFEAVNGLVLFLLDDCCGGDATACAGLNLSHLSAPKC